MAGDFSGDGRLDLAVVDSGLFSSVLGVSVLLGNGDGTFQAQVFYPVVGRFPNSIVAGDFTGDGRLDLAITERFPGYQIAVLLGNGDGTFHAGRTIVAGVEAYTLVAGDFTGDGRLDLATADYLSNAIAVLLSKGDGTFAVRQQNVVGIEPFAIAAGDFNADGRLDLAAADHQSGDVSILLGNGDGTFQPAVEYAVAPGPFDIVAGDFNGDGRLDLAVSYYAGVQILLLQSAMPDVPARGDRPLWANRGLSGGG